MDDPDLLLFDKLTEQGRALKLAPVRCIDVRGTIYSLHLRDPDGSLIKLSSYLD